MKIDSLKSLDKFETERQKLPGYPMYHRSNSGQILLLPFIYRGLIVVTAQYLPHTISVLEGASLPMSCYQWYSQWSCQGNSPFSVSFCQWHCFAHSSARGHRQQTVPLSSRLLLTEGITTITGQWHPTCASLTRMPLALIATWGAAGSKQSWTNGCVVAISESSHTPN